MIAVGTWENDGTNRKVRGTEERVRYLMFHDHSCCASLDHGGTPFLFTNMMMGSICMGV